MASVSLRGPRLRAATGMVVFALLSAACGSTPDSTMPSPSSAGEAKRPHLTISTWRNGDDSILSLPGPAWLVIGDDGCVGVQWMNGQRPRVLRWPPGTRFSSDGRAVIGPASGRRFMIGGEIRVTVGLAPGANDRLPSECDRNVWAVALDITQPL